MSAYVVDKDHIDALVLAGLAMGRASEPLRWFWSPDGAPFEPGMSDEAYRDAMHELRIEDARRVGAMLWSENARSVSHRYQDSELDDLPGPNDFTEMHIAAYSFQSRLVLSSQLVDPRAVFGALRCYEYQACEPDGWKSSEAWAYCNALRDACCNRLADQSGVPWGTTPHGILVSNTAKVTP